MDISVFLKNLKDNQLKNLVEQEILRQKEESANDVGIVFSQADFQKKTKQEPIIGDRLKDAKPAEPENIVGNIYKSLLEKEDVQIKDKFGGDIEIATNFLDDILKKLGKDPFVAKKPAFSKKFYEVLRSALSEMILSK